MGGEGEGLRWISDHMLRLGTEVEEFQVDDGALRDFPDPVPVHE